MAKRIYKYVLEPTMRTIHMPANSKILSVQNQYENICVWAEVDPDENTWDEPVEFEVYGTGHNMTEDVEREFLGTVQLRQGTLVLHIYKVKA